MSKQKNPDLLSFYYMVEFNLDWRKIEFYLFTFLSIEEKGGGWNLWNIYQCVVQYLAPLLAYFVLFSNMTRSSCYIYILFRWWKTQVTHEKLRMGKSLIQTACLNVNFFCGGRKKGGNREFWTCGNAWLDKCSFFVILCQNVSFLHL